MRTYYINVARHNGNTTFDGQPAYSFVFRTDWQYHDEAEHAFRLLDRTLPSPEYKVTIHSRSYIRTEHTSEFRTGLYPDSHNYTSS